MQTKTDDPRFLRIGGMRFMTVPDVATQNNCAHCAMDCPNPAHAPGRSPAISGLTWAERGRSSAGCCAKYAHHYEVAQ